MKETRKGGVAMPITDARKRANKKYNEAHYEKVHFDALIGFKDRVRAAAQAAGVSPSQFMRDAITRSMEEKKQD